MSWDCFELGDSLYIDGDGELAVKLASDSRISVDATDGLYLDDDELSTDWIAWNPTFASGTFFTKGNATVEAYYMRFGQLIFFKVAIKLGSTSSMGLGGPAFLLPVTPASWGQSGTAQQPIGYWASTGGSFLFSGRISQQTSSYTLTANMAPSSFYYYDAAVYTTAPFTWAAGNTIICQGFYERA